MDLRHSKVTLISLGAVDTTGVPALNQITRFFDADTVQGSANFTFDGSTVALTGQQTVSAFLSVGASPAASGQIRLPYTGTIVWRNAADDNDLSAFDFTGVAGAEILEIGFGDIFGVNLSATNAVGVISNFNVTGDQTLSGFLAVGTNPAAAGSVRIPNAGALTMRNAQNLGDLNIWSSPMSDEIDIGDTTIPVIRLLSAGTRVRGSLRIDGATFGETTQFVTSPRTLLLPSGASQTIVGAIPAGALLVGISVRVITAITGPATFSVGDGVDVDRWAAGIPVGLGNTARGTAQTSAVVEFFGTTAGDIVITSDGVDFTGGEVRVIIHYITFTAPTS